MSPILSILILNYNTKNFTIACVQSIINSYKGELEKGMFEIWIGDNASSDLSIEAFKKEFSNYRNIFVIENKKNFGFAKGHNILSAIAKGKYLLFLNSDTQIKTQGLAESISYLEKHDKIGILGLKMINENGSAQASCGKFYNFFNLLIMLSGGERLGFIRNSPGEIMKVDWVSGGAMIIKKALFRKLNGFDENFFMYVEDMELCFRTKKTGFLTYFYPYVSVVHKELASSNRTYAILNIYKGIIYFYKKHKPNFEYLLIKYLFKMKALLGLTAGSISKNHYLTDTYRKILYNSV